METILKGMTWDHERGIAPLIAATKEFQRLYPNTKIEWDKRPLKDFEDYPVSLLAQKYDLMMIDHPFIGQAVNEKVLTALDDYLSEDFLEDQLIHTVGKSHESYKWMGKQWGLAIDTAAQVSAYRADLMDKLNIEVPKTWENVFVIGEKLNGKSKMAIPLNPTHSFSCFITLSANRSNNDFWDFSKGIDEEIGKKSLRTLKELINLIHPHSLEMNPIDVLELMSSTDEIAYVPLIFGYINYSFPGFSKNIVHFTDIPSMQSQPVGGMLGGVGLAISAYSKNKEEAAQFAKLVGSGDCQKGLYFRSGGQPGHRLAWEDQEVNQESNDFFKNTLKTLEHSFLRPRMPGYNLFQEKAGIIINKFLKENGDIDKTMESINQLYIESIDIDK